MRQLTLELIGYLMIGLAVWVGFLVVAVVPERRAKVKALALELVNKFKERAPIVGVRYVGESDDPRNRSQSSGNAHSEALEGDRERGGMDPSEGLGMTKEAWIACLANSELLDDDGNAAPFSKAKIAALVGMRAEDAGKLIDVARGVEPKPKPVDDGLPQFEQVGSRQQFRRVDAPPLR